MRTHGLTAIFLVATVALAAGCSHCCHRPTCPPTSVIAAPGPYGPMMVPAAPAPVAVQGVAPPPAAPGGNLQPPPFPTGPGPQQQANYQQSPPVDSSWQPAPGAARPLPSAPPPSGSSGSVQLAPPEPVDGNRGKDSTRLYPPVDETPPPPESPEPRVVEKRTPPTPSTPPPAEGGTAPSLPVGIPQFTNAKDRVASGLRPMLDDGLDWLQAHGYRTVLHLRKPGEDDTADRKQVEKRGMTYLSLEVSPQTLTRPLVDQFNRLVSDKASYPLFVYDRDGSLAGALWYMHFRTAEQAADDAARVRAGSLGLREDREGTHREMWLAIQRLLSEPTP